jgi:hypothetical protein
MPWVALLGLALAWQAAAAARAEEKAVKADRPAVVVRLAAIDNLVADLRYLTEVAGRDEEAKQFEGMVKNMIGPNGLEGIDTKKPICLYGWIGGSGLDSKAVFLVPIADEKAFLDLLDRLEVKAEKGDDGVYTAKLEKVPFPAYLRFANGYAYITIRDKEVLDKDRLLAPAAVLPPDRIGTLSTTLHIDQVPGNLKDLALLNTKNKLEGLKDKEEPGLTEAQKKLRLAVIDEINARFRSLIQDGGEIDLRLNLDRKAADVVLSASLAGKDGTPLAATIKDLGQVQSIAAALVGPDSAMSGLLNVGLPARVRAVLAPVIEEEEQKALQKEKDQAKRDALAAVLKAFAPTLKTAELDAGFDIRGPGQGGVYTLVAGAKVQDGAAIDKTLRKVVADLPAKQRDTVQLDVEKVGGVAIHRITQEKADEQFRQQFGDNPVYVAVRPDALLVSWGEKGLSALKGALAAGPGTSKVFEFQMALSRVAPLMVRDNKEAPEIAKKAFAKDKDADKVRITLEGGKALRLRMAMKAQVVAFFSLLEQAKKGESK